MTTLRAEDVRALARAGVMLLAAGVAVRLLDFVFASRPVLAVGLAALLFDIWARRLGVRWAPLLDSGGRSRLRTGAASFGTGLILGLVVVTASAALGAASVTVA